jgi:hypothetical protein
LQQHLHERATALLLPEICAEHGEVDSFDLFGGHPSVAWQFEISQRRVDTAPGFAVTRKGGVAAEQCSVQDDRTLLTAMTNSVMKATSMIQRCT